LIGGECQNGLDLKSIQMSATVLDKAAVKQERLAELESEEEEEE